MRSSLLLASLALPLLGSACVVGVEDPYYDDGRGSLTIEYTFGGRSCFDAGVDRIFVDVSGTRDGDSFSLTCAEYDYGVTIDHLREGSYDVYIEGKDVDGNVLFESRDRVSVVAYAHQTYVIDVDNETGSLTIYWTFDGSGRCGDIERLRVRLHDGRGYVYDDASYDCVYEGIVYDAMPKGTWFLDIDSVDYSGRLIDRATDIAVFVEAGSTNAYTVDLSGSR